MPVLFQSVDGLPPRSFPVWVGGLILCAGLAGCGPKVVVKETGTVSGTVVFEGEPVTEGVVNFSMASEGVGALADLDANGEFKFANPLPVGDYVVTISPPRPDPNLGPKEIVPIDPNDYPNIPKKYHSETTSELTAQVIKGENKIEFEMKQ